MKALLFSFLLALTVSQPALAQLPLTSRALSGQVANCSVVRNGPYLQLFIGNGFLFSGNYLLGSQEGNLEYRLQSLVQCGQCVVYDPYYIQSKLNMAINGQTGACRVVPNYPYNQLYIGGQFSGNYLARTSDATLAYVLDRNLNCSIQNSPNPYIQNARTGRYAGCYVTISGQYNQLYVNGIFRGNYVIGYGDAALTNALIYALQSGVCRPIY